MSRPIQIDNELVQKAQTVAANAATLHELREAQSILMPALHGSTLEQTASMLGVSRATVNRLQTRFRKKCRGDYVPKQHGGRRNALMSLEQERAFLAPWAEQARDGGILEVSALRSDLSCQLGRPIVASVVYGLLARHGWRKLAPDTRHPKSDPQAQEEWKKNSPKRWMPC
jgi:transposase